MNACVNAHVATTRTKKSAIARSSRGAEEAISQLNGGDNLLTRFDSGNYIQPESYCWTGVSGVLTFDSVLHKPHKRLFPLRDGLTSTTIRMDDMEFQTIICYVPQEYCTALICNKLEV